MLIELSIHTDQIQSISLLCLCTKWIADIQSNNFVFILPIIKGDSDLTYLLIWSHSSPIMIC